VHEVRDINDSDIEDSPKVGLKLKSHYIKGIAKVGSSMAMILDIDKIISTNEIIEIKSVSA